MPFKNLVTQLYKSGALLVQKIKDVEKLLNKFQNVKSYSEKQKLIQELHIILPTDYYQQFQTLVNKEKNEEKTISWNWARYYTSTKQVIPTSDKIHVLSPTNSYTDKILLNNQSVIEQNKEGLNLLTVYDKPGTFIAYPKIVHPKLIFAYIIENNEKYLLFVPLTTTNKFLDILMKGVKIGEVIPQKNIDNYVTICNIKLNEASLDSWFMKWDFEKNVFVRTKHTAFLGNNGDNVLIPVGVLDNGKTQFCSLIIEKIHINYVFDCLESSNFTNTNIPSIDIRNYIYRLLLEQNILNSVDLETIDYSQVKQSDIYFINQVEVIGKSFNTLIEYIKEKSKEESKEKFKEEFKEEFKEKKDIKS